MAARRDAAQARLNIRAGTQSIPSSPVRGTRVFATGQHTSIKQLVEAASDREEAASVGVSEGKDQNLNVYRLQGLISESSRETAKEINHHLKNLSPTGLFTTQTLLTF